VVITTLDPLADVPTAAAVEQPATRDAGAEELL
jgi:hypothetical protein